MDSLTPDGVTIHKRLRTRALLQRARSAPGCLGLMARMHTVHARYKRRSLSANGAAGWAAAMRPSSRGANRKVLCPRRIVVRE